MKAAVFLGREQEVSVFGAFSSSLADFLSARSLIANRKLALARLITHRFSLSEVVKALEVARAGQVLKVVIHPQASGGG
jgi:threonine dehydrogenase-like Zn-dependent dehydrogenase